MNNKNLKKLNDYDVKKKYSLARIKVVFDDDVRGVMEYCLFIHTALLSRISAYCNKLLQKDSDYQERVTMNVASYGFYPEKFMDTFCINVIKYMCIPPFNKNINELSEDGNAIIKSPNPTFCNLTYNQLWDYLTKDVNELNDKTLDDIISKLLLYEFTVLSEYKSTKDRLTDDEELILHIGIFDICRFKIYFDFIQ